MIAPILLAGMLFGCTVTDGDTIRCGDERIRLLGIDAPEMPGHCRRGRVCAPGDGQAAKRKLQELLAGSPVVVTRIGHDRYGRTLALVSAGGVDLSCAMIQGGWAIYRRDWDNGGRVRAICPGVAK